jgi:prepilin-type N-terminal cleavage/methylation domain-containing protein
MRNARRHGLTLIEIIVAIMLFTVGALGLAAATGSIARQMTASMMRSRSAFSARSRDETAHSKSCSALSSGSSVANGLRENWIIQSGTAATIDQTVERASTSGLFTDRFLSAVPCD